MDRNLVKKNPHCKGYIYLCDPHGNFAHCDYIGYVGHSRGCPVDGCTKKEEKKKKKEINPGILQILRGMRNEIQDNGS